MAILVSMHDSHRSYRLRSLDRIYDVRDLPVTFIEAATKSGQFGTGLL